MENVNEAEAAKRIAYQMEVKKDALKQVQSGDVKVTFTINPEDMPQALYSDPMGQRYQAVLVAINDDETPREQPIVKPKSYAQAAVMLSTDRLFINYTAQKTKGHTAGTDEYIKAWCDVKSKSELVEGTEAVEKFKKLQRDFQFWKNN